MDYGIDPSESSNIPQPADPIDFGYVEGDPPVMAGDKDLYEKSQTVGGGFASGTNGGGLDTFERLAKFGIGAWMDVQRTKATDLRGNTNSGYFGGANGRTYSNGGGGIGMPKQPSSGMGNSLVPLGALALAAVYLLG